jgi:hypothetical protein
LYKNGANGFADGRSIHPGVDLEISFLQLSIAEIIKEVVESILNSLVQFFVPTVAVEKGWRSRREELRQLKRLRPAAFHLRKLRQKPGSVLVAFIYKRKVPGLSATQGLSRGWS